jgi:tripartite-type tricarboxylate transporter receptor subunit TctC
LPKRQKGGSSLIRDFIVLCLMRSRFRFSSSPAKGHGFGKEDIMYRKVFQSVFASVLVLALCSPVICVAAAEKFPSRPVDMIIGSGVGGGSDQMGRNIARLSEKFLGVAMPCSNIAGATGNVAITNLMSGKADGYTLSTYIADTLATIPGGQAHHKVTDLVWLTRTQAVPSYFFVKADSPFKTIQDLLNYAKENPGKLKCSTLGFGSIDDITLRYFALKGFKITNVPYPASSERHVSVLGGHNELTYDQAGDVKQYLDAKQFRPLIVFATKRQASFPDVPCAKELGYDLFLPQFRGIVAKKGVPADRIKILADAMQKAMDTPEWKKFSEDQDAQDDSYMGTEQFTKWVVNEENTIRTFMKSFGMAK